VKKQPVALRARVRRSFEKAFSARTREVASGRKTSGAIASIRDGFEDQSNAWGDFQASQTLPAGAVDRVLVWNST
jgi:hypothetical protein